MLKYKFFEANESKGYNFPFIVVYPEENLLQQITNNGTKPIKIFVEGFNSVDYEKNPSMNEQIESAKQYAKFLCQKQNGEIFNIQYLYQQLCQPVIIPIIERCDFDHKKEFYPQMLGRNAILEKKGKYANLTKQVVAMIDEVKEILTNFNIKVEEKAGAFGVSTSGVFAGRLVFAEPEHFDVCLSISSNAVQPLPLKKLDNKKLPYPIGTADYKEIFGKEFNEDEYKKIQQLFIVGKEESEQYNIINNPRLHDKKTSKIYNKVYGKVSLQTRQEEIEKILEDNNFFNTECLICSGGHGTSGKGKEIMTFINNLSLNNKPVIATTNLPLPKNASPEKDMDLC